MESAVLNYDGTERCVCKVSTNSSFAVVKQPDVVLYADVGRSSMILAVSAEELLFPIEEADGVIAARKQVNHSLSGTERNGKVARGNATFSL